MSESNQDKPSFRVPLLFIGGLYLAVNLLLLVLGGALGWLLHRIWPSIETGTGVLIGVLVTGFSFHLLIKTFGALLREVILPPPPIEEEEEEEEEDYEPVSVNLPPLHGGRPRKNRRRR